MKLRLLLVQCVPSQVMVLGKLTSTELVFGKRLPVLLNGACVHLFDAFPILSNLLVHPKFPLPAVLHPSLAGGESSPYTVITGFGNWVTRKTISHFLW